jgi:glutathione S-transferase
MSFGKLYGFGDNARSVVNLVVAKENKLDIELVETRPPNVSVDYLKLHPLGKVPTFVSSNGFILTESMAIAIYCKLRFPLPHPRHHWLLSLLALLDKMRKSYSVIPV